MRVLVVEDHAEIAETYRLMLEAEGHQVVVAHDGKMALEAYFGQRAMGKTPFDVVVLDFRIPCISGIEVARRILSEVPNQRILIASSYPADAITRTVDNTLVGNLELLTKPFDLVDFIDVIVKARSAQIIGKAQTIPLG